eukprot:gene6553-6409_t
MDQALDATRRGFPNEDVIAKLENTGLTGTVLASGLRALQMNPQATNEDVHSSMEMAGRVAAQELERYLPTLATIASAAPLLGLLGTVVGMIEIFGAHTAGNNQPAQLAHGISVALYNTALGLIVAIPALMFWRYFRGVVDGHLLAMEQPEINLVPFIDLLLVILIFLMLTTTWSRLTEINLTLPVADAQKQTERPRHIILTVTSQGQYAVNKSPVGGTSVSALAAVLAPLAAKDVTLIISADASATHQAVVNAMEAARR